MEFINAIGRRKTAVARVYLKKGKGTIVVNDVDYKKYFPTAILQYTINQPMKAAKLSDKYDVKAVVDGGGVNGQAGALRLAIARAVVKIDAENKPLLKAEELLTRDPRMVERKKPGQKKARKRFQFSKR